MIQHCTALTTVGLPEPKIAYIDQLHSKAKQPPPAEQPKPSPKKPSKSRQDSFGGDPTADPWASPAAKNPPPPSTAAHTMQANGIDGQPTGINGVARTTSTFTTHGSGTDTSGSPPASRTSGPGENAWGGYNGSSGGFSDQPTLGGGFGDEGSRQPERERLLPQRNVSAGVAVPGGTGERVAVTLLPDKEGTFLFQHHNYEVNTIRRASSVVRRYSDFVWLLDCLQKRYPFRRLPLLPPKRIQGTLSWLLRRNMANTWQ